MELPLESVARSASVGETSRAALCRASPSTSGCSSAIRAAGIPISEPRENSNEKGNRNFADAASQIQWRNDALLDRNISVISHAPPQNSVDCQRWLISAE